MYKIILEWVEGGRRKAQIISSEQAPQKKPITIGRDGDWDVVVKDPTNSVSRPHVGIYFDEGKKSFYLQNLTSDRQPPKQPNPAIVDGQKIVTQQILLRNGSQIQLGKEIVLTVNIEGPPQYVVKCNNSKDPHSWPPEYEGRNCPTCGFLILNATIVS